MLLGGQSYRCVNAGSSQVTLSEAFVESPNFPNALAHSSPPFLNTLAQFFTFPKRVSAANNQIQQKSTSTTSTCLAECGNISSTTLILSIMDTYVGSEGDGFLARRGAIRSPSGGLSSPFVGSHPRVVSGFSIHSELDRLVCEAFDCDDGDDTFRGKLRAAMDRIQPNVLTSLCAYRIGFAGDACTEPTLLVTVLPGSLAPSEAIQAIMGLLAVLERCAFPPTRRMLISNRYF